jgi:death-on-curing protein
MIRYLTLIEVLSLHRQIIEQSGGALGVRDLGALESALAQPRMTFGGEDLYPTWLIKLLLWVSPLIFYPTSTDRANVTIRFPSASYVSGTEINGACSYARCDGSAVHERDR